MHYYIIIMKNPSEQTLPPENNKTETDELQEQTSTSEYYEQFMKIPNMEKGKRKEVESWMKKIIIEMLNTTKVEPGKLPLMGEWHALVLSKAYNIRIVIIDNHFAELKKYWDSDSAFFRNTKGFPNHYQVLHPQMLSHVIYFVSMGILILSSVITWTMSIIILHTCRNYQKDSILKMIYRMHT